MGKLLRRIIHTPPKTYIHVMMKNQLPFFAAILILSFLFLSACKKETLDLSSTEYFGIKTLLQSTNCTADCDEIADCESSVIRVRGILDEFNVPTSERQFYLNDEADDTFQLEVIVDEAIIEEVFQKLDGMEGKVFLVEGEMQGFEAPGNFSCARRYFLQVRNVEDVRRE